MEEIAEQEGKIKLEDFKKSKRHHMKRMRKDEDETIPDGWKVHTQCKGLPENASGGGGNPECVWMVEDGRRNVHASWEPKKTIRERDSKSPEEDGGYGIRWSNV